MRWLICLLGLAGSAAAGHLALQWLRDAAHLQSSLERATVAEPSVVVLSLAGYLLLASMVAGVIGAGLATQHRGRSAGTVLLVAGIVPGIVDLRAFVATSVLILASMLAYGLTAPERVWTGRHASISSH